MSLPNQIGAYERELDLLETALTDTKGVRIRFATVEDARYFRFRIQQARSLSRVAMKSLYDEDPRIEKLPFSFDMDKLICRIREDEEGLHWVYIEHRHNDVQDEFIERLSEIG